MKTLAFVSLLGISAAALTACSGPTPRTVDTAAKNGLVTFDADAFASTAPQRVGYIDIWQEEEYAKFEGDGADAVIIYSVADERDSIVLDFNLTLDRIIENWHPRAAGAVSLGEEGTVKAPLGSFDYRQFTVGTGKRPCVAFLNEWDYRMGDPELRPAKVLFGYYCGKGGTVLDKDGVAGLLSDIWIKGIRRIDYRFTPRIRLAAAAGPGAPADASGLHFPYARADRFVDADGERSP